MPTLLGRLILVIKQLLETLSQVVDQVAAVRKQVEDLLQTNAALRARLDQAQRRTHRQAAPFSKDRRLAHPRRPGRTAGQGRFTFRAAPEADAASEPPVDVRRSEPVCPCCGQPLEEERLETASTTELPAQPPPIVRFSRVHVYRCRSCGRTVRARHPELAADQ